MSAKIKNLWNDKSAVRMRLYSVKIAGSTGTYRDFVGWNRVVAGNAPALAVSKNQQHLNRSLKMKIEEFGAIMNGETFVALLRNFGGRRIYVPKKINAQHPIAVVVGVDVAHALCNLMQGAYLDLPTLARYDRIKKRRRIIALRNEGKSIDRVAFECNCSRRHVEKVCADARRKLERHRNEAEGKTAVQAGR